MICFVFVCSLINFRNNEYNIRKAASSFVSRFLCLEKEGVVGSGDDDVAFSAIAFC